ncbi:hypothetical protein ACOSP7_005119 [Xanthoceras sorbifolium]
MADNGGFDGDHDHEHEQGTATSFSQLLFSDNDAVQGLDLDYHHHHHQTFNNNSFSCSSDSCFSAHGKPPKMLCFGDYNNHHSDGELVVFGEATTTTTTTTTCTKSTPQKSGVTCSDSSSASSGNISSANTPSKSSKKRNGSGKESVQCSNSITTTPVASQRTSKKSKADNTSSTGHAKARKEKLGERISTLQQLVSPFGKTDTASVLHEAMGYIRFLQEQVQVLCFPYLQHHLPDGGEKGGKEGKKDLKNRGLCLVPVACTVSVANSNGADFWSPAMGNNASSSPLTKQQ